MSDTPPTNASPSVLRFARLVARMQSEPGALNEHRQEIRAIAKALKKAPIVLAATAEGMLSYGEVALVGEDAEQTDALASLAARMQSYGVERVTLAGSAAEADVFDLVKLLATPADQADPPAFFAARSAAIDARAIPRVLRKKELPPEPVVEAPSVKEPSSSKDAEVRASEKNLEAIVETASAPLPETLDSGDARSERLVEAIAVPKGSSAELAGLFSELLDNTDNAALPALLERMAFFADIAFRTGKFDRLLEVMTALVAIEYHQLDRDSAEERRREFGQVVRRLATPVILRQLAVMRHRRADDAQSASQLQALLYRFGTDGAEALIDEWASAPTAEARRICLEALRALRRTHDSLFEAVRDTDTARVRGAIDLLAALGDSRAEQLLLEQLRHPDARTRRSVAAALDLFPSASAFDALGVIAIDDDATVRLRAVSALSRRGALAVKLLAPMLDTESEREVLYAAVAALGNIGTPEAVQVLVRCANGETEHPRKRSATYRLQACAALALIRTPQAMAAVQMLRNDRDREVREGSMRLVAQASRRGTMAVRAPIIAP